MFEFITATWNPVKYCCYNCRYCWAHKFNLLDPTPRLYSNRLYTSFKNGFIFVCDVGDLFNPKTPKEHITKILNVTKQNPNAKFLLLTKNPERYFAFDFNYYDNVILGATVESDIDYFDVSDAPPQSARMDAMAKLKRQYGIERIFISVEPILAFTDKFIDFLVTNASRIAIGYDNYNNRLPEPSIAKTRQLIKKLLSIGKNVSIKTLRPAWHEREALQVVE